VYCGQSNIPEFAERFVQRRILVSQHAGHEPAHYVDNQGRGQFAATEHKIANRNLIVGQEAGHSFVHPLVTAAKQHKFLHGGELTRQPLVETPTLS